MSRNIITIIRPGFRWLYNRYSRTLRELSDAATAVLDTGFRGLPENPLALLLLRGFSLLRKGVWSPFDLPSRWGSCRVPGSCARRQASGGA